VLSALAGALIATPASAPAASIFPLQELSIDDVGVGEANGNAVFSVTRSGGIGPAFVDYATSDGTATAGADFGAPFDDDGTPNDGTLGFANGQTSGTISVPITNDTADEGFNNHVPNPRAAIDATVPFETFATVEPADLPATVAGGTPEGIPTGFHVIGNASGSRLTFADLLTPFEDPFPFSFWVYVVSNTADGVVLRIRRSSDQALMLAGDVFATTGQWTRLSIVRHSEATENETFSIEQSGVGNVEFYVTGAMVNDHEPPGGSWDPEDQEPYFDGSGYVNDSNQWVAEPKGVVGWSGAAHNSASRKRTETFFVDLSSAFNATITDAQGKGTIIDNDLPPTPAPPPLSTSAVPVDNSAVCAKLRKKLTKLRKKLKKAKRAGKKAKVRKLRRKRRALGC